MPHVYAISVLAERGGSFVNAMWTRISKMFYSPVKFVNAVDPGLNILMFVKIIML